MAQLHKKFSDIQIKEFIGRYLEGKIKRSDIQKVLVIGKTRFFTMVKTYRQDPLMFSIECTRKNAATKILLKVEENIMTEFSVERKLTLNSF